MSFFSRFIFGKNISTKNNLVSMDILSLFTCFETFGLTIQIHQLAIISQAILTMTGRITMRPLSRWTDKGGSYRPINAFLLRNCRGLRC